MSTPEGNHKLTPAAYKERVRFDAAWRRRAAGMHLREGRVGTAAVLFAQSAWITLRRRPLVKN